MNRCPYCFKPLPENGECDCHYPESEKAGIEEALRPGTIVGSDYVIGAVLGEGGFGITYKGYDLRLKKIVAVKEFFPKDLVTRDETMTSDGSLHYTNAVRIKNTKKIKIYHKSRDMFYREAQSLAKLSKYANVVHVYRIFEENDTVYFVMDYVSGKSLNEILREKGRFSEKELLPLLDPILTALENVHNEGMLHRDIAPDNIIIDENGQPVLLDFGAVKADINEGLVSGSKEEEDQPEDSDSSFVSSGSSLVVEKKGFTPLEQIGGKATVRSDIYAMGATYYRLLSGKVPAESYLRAKKDPLVPLKEYGVSPQVSDAVMKAMAFDEEDRWKSIADFRKALPKPDSAVPAPVPWKKILPILLAVLLAVGAGIYFLTRSDPEKLYIQQTLDSLKLTQEAMTSDTEVPAAENIAVPTDTPVPTATNTPAPTDTPVPTETNTPAPTDTPVPTETNTPAATATNTPTATDTPVPTATNTPTATDTPVPTETNTPTPTDTPVPTETNTPTATDTPVPTETNTPAPTDTPVPTATNTPAPTDTPVPTETNTPTVTDTPVPTETNTPAPTDTPVPTATYTPAPTDTPVPTDTPELIPAVIPVHAGEIISFGNYEQDNDLSNGPEPIEWIVLNVDEKNNRAFLLSKYALENKAYTDELLPVINRFGLYDGGSTVNWELAAIREWLNGEFYDAAFSAEEQSEIITVRHNHVETEKNCGEYCRVNAEDNVFLLSEEEAEIYLPNAEDRICDFTSYSHTKRPWDAKAQWWLRAYIGSPHVDVNGNIVTAHAMSVYVFARPAIMIDLSRFGTGLDAEGSDEPDGSQKLPEEEPDPSGTCPLPENISDDPDLVDEVLSDVKENDVPAVIKYDLHAGDTFEFGHYEQDNNTGNGKEPVEWMVLDVQNDRALLLSKKALDTKPWHETDDLSETKDVVWNGSSLRNWLNDEFLTEAFSPDERLSLVENTDKNLVSLLNNAQVIKFFPYPSQRTCTYTDYARANGAWQGSWNAMWWLRSNMTRGTTKQAYYVDANGDLLMYYMNLTYITVRPVVWLSLY